MDLICEEVRPCSVVYNRMIQYEQNRYWTMTLHPTQLQLLHRLNNFTYNVIIKANEILLDMVLLLTVDCVKLKSILVFTCNASI